MLATLLHRVRATALRRAFWRDIATDAKALKQVFPDLTAIRDSSFTLVVSTGRTGTTWLAKALAHDSCAVSRHEPIPREQFAWAAALNESSSANAYADYRVRYIRRALDLQAAKVYVECNGALRRHGFEIKERCPRAYLPMIIRDGRDIVNSVMQRASLTEADPIYWSVRQRNNALGRPWSSLSKFQKACLIWRFDNEHMLEYADSIMRFEDMISSFEVFRDTLCRPLGLEIDREHWASRSRVVENANQSPRLRGWDHWTTEERDFFRDECGSLMSRFGYL
jgi:hypothetical protein